MKNGEVLMPEQFPGRPSSKKWEEMTLEEKVEDLNRRAHGSKNTPYRIFLLLTAYVIGMLFIGGGALLFAWPVLWLSQDPAKNNWTEVIPGMVAGCIGALLGLLAFIAFFRSRLRREWEASSPNNSQKSL
jgi:hypothetical protein